jgi:hypothetical protein
MTVKGLHVENVYLRMVGKSLTKKRVSKNNLPFSGG